MISVVMPYWRRPEILARNLAVYHELYASDNIEIIVVDDGSPEPADIGGTYPWPVKVVSLPRKEIALNPCAAFNAGVAASWGDILVLTNPEVVHRAAILTVMVGILEDIGPLGYVAAACWSGKVGWWYCHSTKSPAPETVGRAPMPVNAGLHFCAMLHRSLYDYIGGFSEEYRDGQGYEDSDLLWKLNAVGANFKIADELVTDHQDCPPSAWPRDGKARNRAIFEARWGRTH